MPARLRPAGRAVALGVGTALAIGLPAALVAQILDSWRDDDAGTGPLTYVLSTVVLAGVALGGLVVGRQRAGRPARLGAAAGVLAITVVLALGISRRAVADEGVAWETVPATALVAAALGAAGSALGARTAGRTRP